MPRCLAAALAALLLVLLAGSCGFSQPDHDAAHPAAALPAWPPPPAEARVQYVRSVGAPTDWGIEKSILQRTADAIAGRVDEAFVRPTGVAEHDGVLYVADTGAPALWILDTARNRFSKVAEAGTTKLVSPVAVAPGRDGAVFVADSALGRVFLVDRDGKLVRAIGENELVRPAGLAYDAQVDRLYVADAAKHAIVVYAPAEGRLLAVRGRRGSADGEFNFPTHLALDQPGTLIVTDALNFRVQAFDRDGRFLWKIGHAGDGAGDFASPKGVAADMQDHLFVVDALFDVVQIFDRYDRLLLAFGERGSGAGQFWLPGSIFISPRNEVYVADAYNGRVQVFELRAEADAGAGK